MLYHISESQLEGSDMEALRGLIARESAVPKMDTGQYSKADYANRVTNVYQSQLAKAIELGDQHRAAVKTNKSLKSDQTS